jgi:hypothetical protein
MSPTPYDVRFIAVFEQELAKRRSPLYPASAWHQALAAADAQEPCTSPIPAWTGEELWSDQNIRCGIPERPVPCGGKKWCFAVNRACDEFWRRRYGT